jgi:hypothetical protein
MTDNYHANNNNSMRHFSSIPSCSPATNVVVTSPAGAHLGGWSAGCGPMALTGKGALTNPPPNGAGRGASGRGCGIKGGRAWCC